MFTYIIDFWTLLHNMAIFIFLTNIPILKFENGKVTQTSLMVL